jgi:hypothetical protein
MEDDTTMSDTTKPGRPSDKKPTRAELLKIIERLIDGIDGYECEHGDLRYWKPADVEEARRLIGAPEGML